MSRTISAPLFGDLEIMTFVIKALYNPYRPSCCSGSLAIALASLPMDPYTMHYKDDEDFHIRNVFHKILYQFVVTRRHDNDRDMVTWMKAFSTCVDCSPSTHCQPISSFCHRTWMEKKGDLTRSHLFRIANLASEKTDPRQTASWSAFLQEAIVLLCGALLLAPFKAVAQGKYPLWPRKLSSLIPFGPDDAVYSILQWFRISPQAPLLQFLLAVVLHVRSPFYPSLIKFNFPTIVINSTKVMLDVFVKIFDEKTIPHVIRMVAVETFMQQSFALSEFLEYFQSRYLSSDVRLFLVDGCETKALQLCSLITCLCPVAASVKDTDDSHLYHELERLAKTTGSSLYRKLNMHLATNPFQQRMLYAVPIVEEDSNKFFGSLDEFEAEMGLSFIWFGGYEYGCAARSSNGCQESLETAGREMKLCDRCVGVYYCGRECQHSDWNDANHPHRKVCPLISRMVDRLHRLEGLDSRRSNRLLRGERDPGGGPVLETIEEIRDMIRAGKLTLNEVRTLKAWGRKIYHTEALDPAKAEFHPGYDDYDATMKKLNDPRGIYNGPGVAHFAISPNDAIARTKALLARQLV